MNNKNFTTVLIPVIIGVVILFGIIYFISLFKEDDKSSSINLNDLKDTTEIIFSKKQAYDKYLNDSTLKIKQENISIDLGSLFDDDNDNEFTKLIPDDLDEYNSTVAEHKPIIQNTNSKPSSHVSKPLANSKINSSKNIDTSLITPKPYKTGFNSFSSKSVLKIKSNTNNETIYVKAVVHDKQEVYEGATIEFMNTNSFLIDNVLIPENTFIYGTASINRERVLVKVTAIFFRDKFISVSLSAFDRDGIEGIYIPGLIQHEVRQESGTEILSETQKALNIPVLGSIPLSIAEKKNTQQTAILTDNYEIILK